MKTSTHTHTHTHTNTHTHTLLTKAVPKPYIIIFFSVGENTVLFHYYYFFKFSGAQTSDKADKDHCSPNVNNTSSVNTTLALILYVCVMTVAIPPPECWLVGVRPPRVEERTISPGDRPESQLLSCPDCISIERTKSYQTSQWRERSPPSQCWRKGKWKLMNRNEVTMAQRQFTTDVSKKSQREGW